MIKAIFGKDKVLMFRLLKNAKEKKATRLALQTSHTINWDRSTDTTQTKDGAITTAQGLEVTVDIDAVASEDEVNAMLRQSVENGDKLEVWEINFGGEPVDGKYPALYMQGTLDSWEMPADVEDLATLTTTLHVDGKPQPGYATVSQEQQEEVLYAFRDVTIFDGKPSPAEVNPKEGTEEGTPRV